MLAKACEESESAKEAEFWKESKIKDQQSITSLFPTLFYDRHDKKTIQLQRSKTKLQRSKITNLGEGELKVLDGLLGAHRQQQGGGGGQRLRYGNLLQSINR